MKFMTIIYILAGIFGAMIGSFLNALIYRLPLDINIALPRSSCPKCKHIISWYDNIPIISYIFLLRGRCRHCHEKISMGYPLIEFLFAFVAIMLTPKNISLQNLYLPLFYFSIIAALFVHFIVDLKHQILPDSVNIYLAFTLGIFSLLHHSWIFGIEGAAIGFFFPWMVSWIFYKLKGQIGLGGGDIKLYGALGLYLGPQGIIHNIFFSCFVGAVVGGILLSLKVIKRETPIPFGPFIIIVGFIQIFFPESFQILISHILIV